MLTATDPRLDADLARCEGLLHTSVQCPGNPFLTAVADHLFMAGGKRLRPMLALLAARFGDPGRPDVIRAAAVVELLHVASLYHDDVMDQATLRRGVPSVNAGWGNRVAVLAGDYLVARAAELAVPLGHAAVMAQSEALRRLVQGQLNETVGAAGTDPGEHYLRVVADKTAALFVLAVRLGAHAAGVPDGRIEALAAYAEAVGIGFQLCDDVLDITAPSDRSGKPAGADVRAGLRTLPVLRALRGGRGSRRLRWALAAGAVGEGIAGRRTMTLLRRSPGLADARAEVARYAANAQAALQALPESAARQALDEFSAAMVRRAQA